MVIEFHTDLVISHKTVVLCEIKSAEGKPFSILRAHHELNTLQNVVPCNICLH
jgi:hypothetical protein